MIRVRVSHYVSLKISTRDLPQDSPPRPSRARVNEEILDEVDVEQVRWLPMQLVDPPSDFMHDQDPFVFRRGAPISRRDG